MEKKQLNVRIPVDLQERIDNTGRPKVDIVTEALLLYFDSIQKQDDSKNNSKDDSSADSNAPEDNSKIENPVDSPAINNDSNVSKLEPVDSNEIARMKNEIDFLRTKLDDILKLLHQEQVLHIQTQRMLTPPQKEKKWWQFWV